MQTGISDTGKTNRRVFKEPRSTHGCITCKIRKKKCDETKPHCLRCIRFGTDCDGYPPSKKSDVGSKRKRILVPRASRSIQELLMEPSSDLTFRNETESRYFQSFREDVIPQLGGGWWLWTTIWNRIIPQACHSESFIREAVVAFAALRKSLVTSNVFSAEHYCFALEYYGKAVGKMRCALSNKEDDLRKALLGCLLLYGFEAFQGNQELALCHARGGLQLLQQWVSRKSSRNKLGNVNTSPDPSIVEDDIVFAHYHLDMQLTTWVDPQSHHFHKAGSDEDDYHIKRMPKIFSDFSEACRYLVLITRRSAHFIHTIWASLASKTWNRRTEEQESMEPPHASNLNKMYFTIMQRYDYRIADVIPRSQLDVQAKYVNEFKRWEAAFDPFRSFSRTKLDIAIIGVVAKVTEIALRTITEYHTSEKFYSEFREILRLCRELSLQTSPFSIQGQKMFSVHSGIVQALSAVYTLCRDRSIRREALEILQLSPRREGLWDSQLIAGIGTWMMELEEEEEETEEYASEDITVKLINIDVDARARTASLQCSKQIGSREILIFMETTISWG